MLEKGVWVRAFEDVDEYANVLPVRTRWESTTWDPAFKIQIMWLDENISAEDLLERFDCSCHAWALLPDGTQVRGRTATVPGEPIVLRDESKKYDLSQDRLRTFTDRYAHLKETT
jgi:hypothetical protein